MYYQIISVGASSEFYLHLVGCHLNIFNDMASFLRRERRSEFYEDETLLA